MGKSNQKVGRKALTPEARENQLVSLAFDRAEEKLRDGTASQAMIIHFLKMGSTEERVKQRLNEEQLKLAKAKTEMIESSKKQEELFKDVISAMKRYSGHGNDDENIDEYFDDGEYYE